jgi:leucine dehydrogenase
MPVHILDAMTREGLEEVVALHDPGSGLSAFLALQGKSRGPSFGGIRRYAYPSERAALLDCLRLARAMAHKVALADLPAGGGKIVLLDRPELDPQAAYRFLGAAVERMAGRFCTGPDVGTGAGELAWVAEATRYVAQSGTRHAGDLVGATVVGAFAGVRAALRHLDGELDWPRRTIVLQGLGEVGSRLAERLVSSGARVIASEIDEERAKAQGERLGIELVEPGGEYGLPCDVFAPCAMGGVLHDLTIQRLAARSVVGAANNILARSHQGEKLHSRRVLYVPEVVVNSGALLRGATFHLEGRALSDAEIDARITRLAEEILARAAAEQRSPADVATEEALRRLGSQQRKPAEA